MIIGTQYLRPPNPEREVWAEDMAHIRELGLKIVRCWLYWRHVEPTEGEWTWSDYDDFLELAAANDLQVLIQLIPECQPNWFLQRHRDCWPRRADGSVEPVSGMGMVVGGGYPGVYPDWPVAAEATSRFFLETVQRYAKHPALYGWDVWNEFQPHGGPISYDDPTRERWQRYLGERFGAVGALNAALLTQYGAFAEVDLVPPLSMHSGSPKLHLIFTQFQRQRTVDELRRRCELVRQIDTVHRVTAHPGTTVLNNSRHDDWHAADLLDCYGTSQYLTEYQLGETNDYCYGALYYAISRSAAGASPWWLSEVASGHVFYQYGHTCRTGAETQATLLQAKGHGAEAALLWQYRNERFGEEAPSWGFVNFDGSDNERTKAVQELTSAISRHRELLEAVYRLSGRVGILNDLDSPALEARAASWHRQGIGAAREAEGWFFACLEAGFTPEVWQATHLEQLSLKTCGLLILPMRTALPAATIPRLLTWVEAGGMLIATACTGLYDDNHFVPRILPAQPWSDAFGMRVLSRWYNSDISLTGGGPGPLKGYWTVEELRVDDAEVVATWEGHPAITRRTYGAGSCWYVGTCPGHAGERGSLVCWLREWATLAGIGRWFTSELPVFGERAAAPGRQVIYLTNPHHEPVTVNLDGHEVVAGDATDLLHGKRLGSHSPANPLLVTVPARCTGWIGICTG